MLKSTSVKWPGQPFSESLSGEEDFEVGPNDQGDYGTVFCFAYALPYTYTDLMSDLENSKQFLLSLGGTVVNQQQARSPVRHKTGPKVGAIKAKKRI